MLKKYHQLFQSIDIVRDIIAIGIAFVLAYITRFYTWFPYETISQWNETKFMFVMSIALWPIVAYLSNLYRSWRSRSWASEAFALFKITILTTAIMIVLTYFVREIRYSRGVLILFPIMAFSITFSLRLVSRFFLHRLREKGYNLRRVLIIGDGLIARRTIQAIERSTTFGIRIEGILSLDKSMVGKDVEGTKVIGHISSLEERLQREPQIDQVIVTLPLDRLQALRNIMGILSDATVDVRLIPDLFEFITLQGSVEEFAGLPIIDLQTSPLEGWSRVNKRAFDLAFGLLALIISAPIMAIIAFLIKLSSPGPIIFKQIRMGMDGELFEILKFRTMRIDAEEDGPQMATQNDTRTTKIGSLLRRTSLDELPQLFNVIKGQMSLVGPRPERPCYIEEFRHQIPRYYLRHKIKAGLTGLAQVNGYRGSNTSIAKRIEYDLFYIEKWSLTLDFKILASTVLGGLFKNAY